MIIISWVALYMVGHSTYVSDQLRKMIIERSVEYTGQKISIEEISINPIPIFIELKGISVEDHEEGQWLKAGRIKIYIDLMDLFIKKISVRRVLIQEADLKLTKDSMSIMGIVGKGRSGKSDIDLKNIDLRNSRIFYKDGDIKVKGSDVNISAYLRDAPEINFDVGGIDFESKAISLSSISTKGRFHVKGRTVTVYSLHLESDGSKLDLKGKIYPDTREFNVDASADISVSELSKMLGLSV
ncbi:MAG: hypothetical protein V3V59_00915, partial [Thermodesulfovibrionales bacterium]